MPKRVQLFPLENSQALAPNYDMAYLMQHVGVQLVMPDDSHEHWNIDREAGHCQEVLDMMTSPCTEVRDLGAS